MKKDDPIITLIGRTNVGKSTIFNRLIEAHKAIISAVPGTTRDVRYGTCLWRGKNFLLADTAGLDVESDAPIDKKAIEFSYKSLKDSKLCIFIVDGKAGLLPQDKEYAQIIKKEGKKTVLVVNKVDSAKILNQVEEFYKLGFEKIFSVSAKTGAGLGDLLDYLYDNVDGTDAQAEEEEDLKKIKVAIIGKPNVGKSSLINKVIGEEKVIVSDIPHTTRESQDIDMEYETEDEKYKLTLIDTAGIIKKRKIKDTLQKLSIEQSINTIKKSDLCLLMLDCSEEFTVQDKNLAREILDNNKSLIFVINKWDLMEDKYEHSDKEFIEYVHGIFPYLTWAPIVFISAKTGFKVERLLKEIIEINKTQTQRITDEELMDFKRFLVRKQTPKKSKGTKPPYIHDIKHVKTNPLTFEVIADDADNLHFSYRRYIQNQLRDRFKLWGCGIKLRLTNTTAKKSHQT